MRTFFLILTAFFFGLGVFFAALAPESFEAAQTREAEKVEALRAGPPRALLIEAFEAPRDAGPANETMVRAQIPPEDARPPATPAGRWLTPLLATDETDPYAAPLGYAAHPRLAWRVDGVAVRRVGDGPAGGALVEINGAVAAPRAHRSALERVGAEGALVIEPYLEGRAVALAPATGLLPPAYASLLAPLLSFAFAGVCAYGARSAKLRAALLGRARRRRTLWHRPRS